MHDLEIGELVDIRWQSYPVFRTTIIETDYDGWVLVSPDPHSGRDNDDEGFYPTDRSPNCEMTRVHPLIQLGSVAE